MKKYKLNYLIMLSMFVFTVSSCVKMKQMKQITESLKYMKVVNALSEDMNLDKENLLIISMAMHAGDQEVKVDKEQIPLISRAMNIGQLEIANTLKDAGISERFNLSQIKTVLTLAYFEVVEILRDAGIKADAENEILIKMALAYLEFIETLQKVGLENKELLINNTLLNRVVDEGNLEIKKALREAGVKVDAGENNLFSKIISVHIASFQSLLQTYLKFEMNAEDMMSTHIALAKGHIEFVKALSETSIKTDVESETSANANKCKRIFKD